MPFFCIRCKAEIDSKYKACPFCGEPITDFLRDHLLTPIDGKYKILETLGVGGMGEVYKVLHVHLNSVRVIKLMRSKIAGDPGAHERFLREARLATKIHHPNVATLFDFSTLPDGSHYMVWEYIEGINLHQLIKERGPLSPRHAARLSEQVLVGLDAIHRAGIVHRDVSPENIMIAGDDEGEHVKIIDLGIAKQGNEEGADKTKTGLFVGKWKYCSPEHLGMLGAGERIDGRADIYSFGIVLYEMLTGVAPFQASTPHGFLLLHSSERPRALRSMNPSVTASPELEALIFRALEKNRNDRFPTARDFARALEPLIPLLDDKPGTALPARMFDETEELTRPADDFAEAREAHYPSDAETVSTVPRTAVRMPVAAPPTMAADLESRPTFVESTSSSSPAAGSAAPTVVTSVTGSMPTVVESLYGPAPGAGELPTVRLPRPRAWMAVAGGIVAVLILIGVMLQRGEKTEPTPSSGKPSPPVAAHLGINAFPWGEVRSIRNLSSGKTIDLREPLVTPVPIELDPGKYELTLSNPAFKNPILRTVELRSGEQQMVTVQFADPEKVRLPRFEGGR
jgi:serine/threonine protein kinase